MIELLDSDQVWEARELSYSLRPLVHAIMGGGQGAVMAKYALWAPGCHSTARPCACRMVGISDDEVSACVAPCAPLVCSDIQFAPVETRRGRGVCSGRRGGIIAR